MPTGKLHKKEKTRRLKSFPAGYIGSFYRNLADNVINFLRSDFYGKITNDVDIPSEDVQKYFVATSDFAKGIQNDIITMSLEIQAKTGPYQPKYS